MKANKLASYFFIITLVLHSIPSLYSQETKKLSKDEVILAWDFHGVLVNQEPWLMIKKAFSILWKSNNKWELISLITQAGSEAYSLNKACSSAEDLLIKLIAKYPVLKKYDQELMELVNLQTPNQGAIDSLIEMKNKGFQNYLASNIGKRSLAIMQSKYPKIFEQFKGSFIPEDNDKDIAKPCVEYYIGLRKYLIKQNPNNSQKPILFIDDQIDNIKGAESAKVNIESIHFKNADQLKQEFNKYLNLNTTL
ncbi:MAG: hypothetical protein WDZ41_03395 [Candidatus Babeliales bacterium]